MPHPPLVVGVGSVVHREDSLDRPDVVGLMTAAARRALDDAGLAATTIDAVLVPRGSWGAGDGAAAVAARLGVPHARTVCSEIGVLQLSLVDRALGLVAAGQAGTVLVVGGEARHGAALARRAGHPEPPSGLSPGEPHETIRPAGNLLTEPEIARDLTVPAHQYAVIESAVRAAAGRSIDEHRAHLGRLWHRFAIVAAGRSDTWDPSCPSAEHIVQESPANRLIAEPYTRLLCSQWNVDMAAAILITSTEHARRTAIATDRWVTPLGVATSDLIVPLPGRDELHRWPALRVAGERLGEATGVDPASAEVVEIYSCFPSAVEVAAVELGLGLDASLTVFGGMTFGGGPFNHYVLQSLVAVVEELRRRPGAIGLTTAVSGLLTKPGVALWTAGGAGRGHVSVDVTAEAGPRTTTRRVDGSITGVGAVVGYTITGGSSPIGIAVVDLDGVRTVATTADPDLVGSLAAGEWVGRAVRVGTAGSLDGPS